MDDARFDEIARRLNSRLTRRHAGGLATGALLALGLGLDSDAKKKKKKKKKNKNKKKCKPAKFCNGKCGVQKCQKKQVDCGPCATTPGCDQATACSGKCGTVTCQGQQFNCGTCPSGDCDVCASGCTYQTIQAAINAASSGSTITICAGTYTRPTTGTLNVARITNKTLTLIGAGAEQTILDGGGAEVNYPVVSAYNTENATPAQVVLKNMTVTGAKSTPGIALQSSSGFVDGTNNTLTLEQVTVRNNHCYGVGGGIWNAKGTVTLNAGTQVRNNHAGEHGGGIYSSGTLILNDGASVTSNKTDDDEGNLNSGGGIYNSSGHVTLNNGSLVAGNVAGDNDGLPAGGGIYSLGGNVTLEPGSVICGNSPEDCAGTDPLAWNPGVCPDTPQCPG